MRYWFNRSVSTTANSSDSAVEIDITKELTPTQTYKGFEYP